MNIKKNIYFVQKITSVLKALHPKHSQVTSSARVSSSAGSGCARRGFAARHVSVRPLS